MSTSDIHQILEQAKDMADHNGLDVNKLETLLQRIEKVEQRRLSKKYKAIFYLSTTGLFSAEDLAKIFNHSLNNLNSDFNKNLVSYLKDHLELGDNERVGITSLRRVLFQKGYFKEMSDGDSVRILSKSLKEDKMISYKPY